MKPEIEITAGLKPFLEMVRIANSSKNPEKEQVIEDFKQALIGFNICGIKEDPFILDKLFDEILED